MGASSSRRAVQLVSVSSLWAFLSVCRWVHQSIFAVDAGTTSSGPTSLLRERPWSAFAFRSRKVWRGDLAGGGAASAGMIPGSQISSTNSRVAFAVPLHPPRAEWALRLARSFWFHLKSRNVPADLYFIYSSDHARQAVLDRLSSVDSTPLADPRIVSELPPLSELYADLPASIQKKLFFREDRDQFFPGERNLTGFPGDVKQLFALRRLCGVTRPTRELLSELPAYRYVAFFDAETLFLRSPGDLHPNSLVGLLDDIYGRREIWAGNAGKCFPWLDKAGAWMRGRIPEAKRALWNATTEFGYTWYNQMPFLRCDDAAEFLTDIGFPPKSNGLDSNAGEEEGNNSLLGLGRNAQRWEFMQLLTHSWLWARRGWTISRRPGPDLVGGHCKHTFCCLEMVGWACGRFATDLLAQMGTLWAPLDHLQLGLFRTTGQRDGLLGELAATDFLLRLSVVAVGGGGEGEGAATLPTAAPHEGEQGRGALPLGVSQEKWDGYVQSERWGEGLAELRKTRIFLSFHGNRSWWRKRTP